jgi:hypothetical protein
MLGMGHRDNGTNISSLGNVLLLYSCAPFLWHRTYSPSSIAKFVSIQSSTFTTLIVLLTILPIAVLPCVLTSRPNPHWIVPRGAVHNNSMEYLLANTLLSPVIFQNYGNFDLFPITLSIVYCISISAQTTVSTPPDYIYSSSFGMAHHLTLLAFLSSGSAEVSCWEPH